MRKLLGAWMTPQQSKEWFEEMNHWVPQHAHSTPKSDWWETMYQAFKARMDAEREGGDE